MDPANLSEPKQQASPALLLVGSADCVPVDRNGNKGRANETTAQIKSPDGKACLKFSAPSRGGSGLTMETCNTDPQNCVVKRCFYSDNLGDEMW